MELPVNRPPLEAVDLGFDPFRWPFAKAPTIERKGGKHNDMNKQKQHD